MITLEESMTIRILYKQDYSKKRIQRFCNPTTEGFVNLIEVEAEHPVYKEKFAAIHPDFSDFFLAAVKHYAATKLRGREK